VNNKIKKTKIKKTNIRNKKMAKSTPTIDLKSENQFTKIGSESIAYIALWDTEEKAIKAKTGEDKWKQFPCVIKQKLDLEPKTGQIEDDMGRIIYSYSQPSKAKYSASIIQRDAKTFDFFRDHAQDVFLMWVVVGQVGDKNQEIQMYGKFGGNYSEDMSGDPNIPIEFNCEVNPSNIVISTQPDTTDCFAEEFKLAAKQMVRKIDTPIDPKQKDNDGGDNGIDGDNDIDGDDGIDGNDGG
jgi:hypothetical protein